MTEPVYKERSAQFVEFTQEGQTVEGILTGVTIIEVSGKDTKRYTVQTAEGAVSFLGGVQIDDCLSEADITLPVKIVYVGSVGTRAGRTVKQFRVFVAEE